MNDLRDAWRLMIGTLTRIPVRPPTRIDVRVAGRSLMLAPLGGALLAALILLPWWLLVTVGAEGTPLLLAVLAVAALAYLTRAIHLDGLADTADGLGSGRSGEAALAIMKQSDIGPFGVITLLLSMLAQVVALAALFATDRWLGAAALFTALVLSRGMLALLGTSAFPAARTDGLGHSVAGTVTSRQLGGAALLAVVPIVVVWLVCGWHADGALGPDDGVRALIGAACGVAAGWWVAVTSRRRLGGVSGDVYGAAVEVTATATLVATVLAFS